MENKNGSKQKDQDICGNAERQRQDLVDKEHRGDEMQLQTPEVTKSLREVSQQAVEMIRGCVMGEVNSYRSQGLVRVLWKAPCGRNMKP